LGRAIACDLASKMSKPQDPFYVVKDKIEALTPKINNDFENWKDIFASNTTKNTEFNNLDLSLKTSVKSVSTYLNDLSQVIAAVEKNRSRFPNIDDRELSLRKKFVSDTTATLEEIRGTLSSEKTRKKIEKDERETLLGTSRGAAGTSRNFVTQKLEEQASLHDQQNEILGNMTDALTRLGSIAQNVNSELTTQKALLTVMDNRMDEQKSQFDQSFDKMEKLFPNSSAKRWCILFLVIIAFVEIILIIYT
jgi:hypothetical protein